MACGWPVTLEAVSRGNAVRSAGRVALVASSGVVVVLALLSGGGLAGAQPIGRQFVPVNKPLIWHATTPAGTAESSPVTLDAAEVGLGEQFPDFGIQLSAGQHYFYVALYPTYPYADAVVPMTIPPTPATLTTADGTVIGPVMSSEVLDDATWFFPVPADIGAVTLHVGGFSKSVPNIDAVYTPWTFSPSTVAFVPTAPVPTTTTTTKSFAPAGGRSPHAKARAHKSLAVTTGGSTPTAAVLGAGVAGAAVLAAGGAGLTSLLRRRRFYRADREGRVVLSGPPALVAGATLAGGAALPPGRQAIVVKLLGALEIEGTSRPVTSGPVLEIIVFLALNPGRTFTSVQLRESIWGLGRQPITSNTFRKYMVQLRKSLGPGVVVTDIYRYQLTGILTSDWDRFQNVVAGPDVLVGREQGLTLVRGPVLHGSFDGRKNSPFSWATGNANDIEDQVTSTAADLALACLDLRDPRRAASAVSQGLLCSEANLRLRTIDLRVGAALGGPNEVGRRLQAGRGVMATFPKDVTELEEEARTLGWVSVVPG
jgi:hypothetical protein